MDLKQSGRNWNNLLHSHLIADGFVQSLVDTCVYFKETDDPNETCTILVWVDDILLSSKSETVMTNIKKSLSKHFHMKDLGPISWFLGIELKNEKGSISMSQGQYIENLLQKFKMENSKPKQTACDMNVNRTLAGDKQTETGQTNENIQSKHYREIVGSLIYIMTSTRPDICFIVTKLSQYLSNADELYMILAKHVLRYLKATKDQRLIFRKSVDNLTLSGFSDSDWGNSGDRKSITGYCFKLSKEGPLISWKSKKQQSVALSSCEAEYMACNVFCCARRKISSFISQ
ncbi:retrovirus-related pol polyprotein from transposon tnt 1-94 [Plakobranchus ocellatus]|uniref:Retrovirus-related pol polyprotein from transposon tnt 1-94 n=1 Tax=Plakobranchus ocellatus TaxID=259542 RepID=A0AAV4B317_9GAST|nr:retrovirus-related pol polyprotein from transposon tnt 1-94 [Plakobranchus ocellatus]